MKKNKKVAKGLFFTHITLLCAALIGFSLWTDSKQAEAAKPSKIVDPTIEAEREYYKALIYAVNEINNQLEQFEQELEKGITVTEGEVQQKKQTIEQLFLPLQHPPERFTISYMIASDMKNLYLSYTSRLVTNGEQRIQVKQQLQKEYGHFQENFQLMQVFDQFQSLDIDCH